MRKTSKLSLLEKALVVKHDAKLKKEYNDEEVELAIAWVKGKITTLQYGRAVEENKTSGGAVLYRIASILRWAYSQGRLRIHENILQLP